MTVQILKVVALALASFSIQVDALATGIVSCGAGDTAINTAGSSHIGTGFTSGALSDIGVTFSIDGVALTAGSTTPVSVGAELAWSVAAQSAYKGILVRVETPGAFTLVSGDATMDAATPCTGTAQGLDHVSSAAKTSNSGTMTFDAAGTVTVDVIIVVATLNWGYSPFTLSVEAAAVPVDAPVDVPVDAPVDVPVDAPPVDVPVDAPMDMPVETPAPTPVAVPAPVPDVPTDEPPTVDGECPEGKGKKGKKDKKDKGDYESGKGKGGKDKKDGKMKKCKKEPKEPKTPKAGKGGKGDDDAVGKGKKGGKGDDDAVRLRKRN
jgi:hypothetical protein